MSAITLGLQITCDHSRCLAELFGPDFSPPYCCSQLFAFAIHLTEFLKQPGQTEWRPALPGGTIGLTFTNTLRTSANKLPSREGQDRVEVTALPALHDRHLLQLLNRTPHHRYGSLLIYYRSYVYSRMSFIAGALEDSTASNTSNWGLSELLCELFCT